MKAALYHRVSTIDQDPALARGDLEAAARRYGFDAWELIEETGSGAKNNRPGLQKVLAMLDVDAVIVWKLDRFGRSALDLLMNIQRLSDRGVRFIAVTQGIDIKGGGGDPMSRLLLTMLAGVAQFERELIVERTRLGIAKARAAGKFIGRPPRPGPKPETIGPLRDAGMSWTQISRKVHCSKAWARRAYVKYAAKREAAKPAIPGGAPDGVGETPGGHF